MGENNIAEIICFAGKGGVGKSTCSLLFLKYILLNHFDKKILVIDADPDANILDMLNEPNSFYNTISGRVKKIQYKINRKEVPPHASEKSLIEQELLDGTIKFGKFDVIVQGRREGEGCYCSVNNILKNFINILAEIYDIIIIDSPAGLEFFARKTSTNVNHLIIVIDNSKMSLHTLERILEIKKEVSLEFNNVWILGNRFTDNSKNHFIKKNIKGLHKDNNAKLLGFLSYSENIQKFNLDKRSLLDLSESNLIYQEALNIFSKVI